MNMSSSQSSDRCKGWSCIKPILALLLAAAAAAAVALLLVIRAVSQLCELIHQRRRDGNRKSSFTLFSYDELKQATKNFNERELLGRGGTGSVYKGSLPDGSLVAVKLLTSDSQERQHQFTSELSIISCLQHPNLVSLRGWCHEKNKLLLVYEFMSNGSLDHVLFDHRRVLQWEQRYRIAQGVAEALRFLHEGWDQRIVHRDVKTANILLDDEFVPRLGDFGLARFTDGGRSIGGQVMTKAGTLGYISPELAYTGRATVKSDVYGYGVVLLEIATGLRALDKRLEADHDGITLLDYVWRAYMRDELLKVADKNLKGSFDEAQMLRVLSLALVCCHPDFNSRPTMKECCQVLDECVACPLLPETKPVTISFFPDPGSEFLSQSISYLI